MRPTLESLIAEMHRQTFWLCLENYDTKPGLQGATDVPVCYSEQAVLRAIHTNENIVVVLRCNCGIECEDVSRDFADRIRGMLDHDERYPAFVEQFYPWQAMQRDARIAAE